MSNCVINPEVSREGSTVEQIYAAAGCTLQTTQGTSATESDGFSFHFQLSPKLCRLEHDLKYLKKNVPCLGSKNHNKMQTKHCGQL